MIHRYDIEKEINDNRRSQVAGPYIHDRYTYDEGFNGVRLLGNPDAVLQRVNLSTLRLPLDVHRKETLGKETLCSCSAVGLRGSGGLLSLFWGKAEYYVHLPSSITPGPLRCSGWVYTMALHRRWDSRSYALVFRTARDLFTFAGLTNPDSSRGLVPGIVCTAPDRYRSGKDLWIYLTPNSPLHPLKGRR